MRLEFDINENRVPDFLFFAAVIFVLGFLPFTVITCQQNQKLDAIIAQQTKPNPHKKGE